jgi:selenide,water dikinase
MLGEAGLLVPVDGGVGPGLDCAVVPTKHKGLVVVSTIDFFYPLVLDPYMQGKIGCANVLSDLYAMGVHTCDNMLMVLAASQDMNVEHRKIVTGEMIRGFSDLAKEGGTIITGGQTVLNPWPIIGGVAQSTEKSDDVIMPENAIAGDVLVLTKHLGTQLAVNLAEWLRDGITRPANDRFEKVADLVSPEEAVKAYKAAERSMARLNRTGARLMKKFGAHCATDVTGFGILGHATNLVKEQKAKVDFVVHTLPIIRGMEKIDGKVHNFGLLAGTSAETSGGLLIAMPEASAAGFLKEIEEADGEPAWIVGNVVEGTNTARLVENPTIIPTD